MDAEKKAKLAADLVEAEAKLKMARESGDQQMINVRESEYKRLLFELEEA